MSVVSDLQTLLTFKRQDITDVDVDHDRSTSIITPYLVNNSIIMRWVGGWSHFGTLVKSNLDIEVLKTVQS